MSRAIDLFVTYRFLKLLVTPWKKQEAYKQGIIDANGKTLIKKPVVLNVYKQKTPRMWGLMLFQLCYLLFLSTTFWHFSYIRS